MVNEIVSLDNGDFEVLPIKEEGPYVFARDLEIELMLKSKAQPEEKKKESRIHIPTVRENE